MEWQDGRIFPRWSPQGTVSGPEGRSSQTPCAGVSVSGPDRAESWLWAGPRGRAGPRPPRSREEAEVLARGSGGRSGAPSPVTPSSRVRSRSPSARRRSPLSPGFVCPLCWPAVSASRPLPPTAPAWMSGRHPAWCGGPAVVTGGPSAVLLSAAARPSLTAWLVWLRLGLPSFDALRRK